MTIEEAARVFETLGAHTEKVDVTFLRNAAVANSLVTPADGAAFHRDRLREHPEWFGADVRLRLEQGRDLTSTEYSLMRKVQSETKHRMSEFFKSYDALLLPSTAITAPMIEGNDAVAQAKRLTRFTAPFNQTGMPAISVPCGFNGVGLPIGLQIVSGTWKEATVLRAARAYEKERGELRLPM
jgi:aspartyl-tRNA(Asn)/glutamyl-tRNA(Gln) amidotransferase subunit A